MLPAEIISDINGIWGFVSLCCAIGFGEYVRSEYRKGGAERLRFEAGVPVAFYFSGSSAYHLTAWATTVPVLPVYVGYVLLAFSGTMAFWAGICILRVCMRDRWGNRAWIVPAAAVVVMIIVTVARRTL
jgi:hypothetical protein